MEAMVNEEIGKCRWNYKGGDFKGLRKSGMFFFCTIREAKYLLDTMNGVVAYDRNAFNVSSWLPFVEDSALNWKNSYYLHAGQLSAREIGMFCRSNGADKQWSGQMIRDDSDIRLIQSQVGPDEMMFVAPEKKGILGEWRIWMHDGKCVAGTKYRNPFCEYGGEGGSLEGATEFAEWLAGRFEPDERYVADIAITFCGYKLVEYNSYSTSGFYDVDADLLVARTLESFSEEGC